MKVVPYPLIFQMPLNYERVGKFSAILKLLSHIGVNSGLMVTPMFEAGSRFKGGVIKPHISLVIASLFHRLKFK